MTCAMLAAMHHQRHALFRTGQPRGCEHKAPCVMEYSRTCSHACKRRYVISVARKLGCTVFIVWEDIVGGNEKNMLM